MGARCFNSFLIVRVTFHVSILCAEFSLAYHWTVLSMTILYTAFLVINAILTCRCSTAVRGSPAGEDKYGR